MKHNWTYKNLGEVVKCYRGLTYSKADEVPSSSNMVLRSNNIDLDSHTLNFDDIKCVRENLAIAEDKKLKKDSIFICMSNGSMQHLGKVAYVDKDYDYAFGGFMGLIVPDAKLVLPKYVYYALLAPSFLATILRDGHGANINNLRFSELEKYSLPIPSDEEQQAIVRELDLINRLIQLQEQQLRDCDKLAQSVFYTTFGSNPDFARKTIAEVSSFVNDGDWIESKDQSESGIRLIQTGNIGVGVYRDKGDKARYISEATFKALQCTEIFPGDCLISRLPDPIGRACILPKFEGRAITAVDCTILRFKENILPEYFIHFATSQDYFDQVYKYSTGATRKRISRKNLMSVQVPVPPLALQQTFAAQIETIEQQKALIRRSLEDTRTLLAARMQYYFE